MIGKLAAATAGAVLFFCASARATITLTATLNNASETSPIVPTLTTGGARPASFGDATFTIPNDLSSITFVAHVFNIDVTGTQTTDVNDNLGNAHIHASATVTPTTNAPVVWGFFGTPFNDNTPNDMTMTPFANGVGGTFSGKWDPPEGNNTTLIAQINNVISGQHSYINFHTTQFTGGEIRGNIVPEPASVTLLVFGTALIGMHRRR